MLKPLLAVSFICINCWTGLVPLTVKKNLSAPVEDLFPGWPSIIDGAHIWEVALSDKEQLFAQAFPGRIARFKDGSRELLIRWVTRPTRQLHPAADCFRGMGYRVAPHPLRRDAAGRLHGCFVATKMVRKLLVCEIIIDDNGGHWSDISSWYWAAVRARTEGPWWSITVAEPIQDN